MSSQQPNIQVPEGADPAIYLMELIQKLYQQMDDLQTQVRTQTSGPSVPTYPSHAATTGGRRKLPDPDRFAGKRDTVKTFVEQVDNVLSGESASFGDDHSRRAYMVSLLTGDAYNWYSNLVAELPTSLDGLTYLSYADLRARILVAFGDSDKKATAKRKLLSLRQGRGSAQEFAIKFRMYAPKTGMSESDKIRAFEEGLRDEMAKYLIPLEPAADLDSMIRRTIVIDDRLFQYNQMRQHSSRQTADRPTRVAVYHNPLGNTQTTYEKMDLSATQSTKTFPKGPLPEEEKERRVRLNLCRYCAGSHVVDKCPKLAQKEKDRNQGSQRQFVMQMEPEVAPTRFHEVLDEEYSKN